MKQDDKDMFKAAGVGLGMTAIGCLGTIFGLAAILYIGGKFILWMTESLHTIFN